MPFFFRKKEDLPSEILARWDHAVIAYERVMQEICGDDPLLRMLHDNQNRQKSALFWRLLCGKDPLPFPPPRRFGYPWYEVIEENGPHLVIEARFPAHKNWKEKNSDDKLKGFIFLEQCRWEIISCNDVAENFIDNLQNPALSYQEKSKIMSESPELLIQFDNYPVYRLFVGRELHRTSIRYRDYFISHAEIDWRGTNAVLIEEDPINGEILVECDAWFLEKAKE